MIFYYFFLPDRQIESDIRKNQYRISGSFWIESNRKIDYPCGADRITDILKIPDIRSVLTPTDI